MIACDFDSDAVMARIILSPNRSWTWRANAFFVITLMVISLTIAAVFTARGFWVVLPFTLLEMSVLTGCLYYCVRRTHTMEVLSLNREQLVFERGIREPSIRLCFERYFTRFFVKPARHPWYRKTIELKCRDQALEVGQFLCDEEKDQLIRELRNIIHKLDNAPKRD
jgi:uncharacterized membrane protein